MITVSEAIAERSSSTVEAVTRRPSPSDDGAGEGVPPFGPRAAPQPASSSTAASTSASEALPFGRKDMICSSRSFRSRFCVAKLVTKALDCMGRREASARSVSP